ncbi:MAG TPA: hypothetical protein PLZ57_08270 [Pseudobdellovibrionaceae bacterium]|nr:hypothetical protein [Pseudobdellovibrionaceae bacterium]
MNYRDMSAPDRRRWWIGGGVTLVALVVGFWAAVRTAEVRTVELGVSVDRQGRQIAAEAGEWNRESLVKNADGVHRHNGGKPRIPVEVDFDGEKSLTLTETTNVIVTIRAEADLREPRVRIEGIDGLEVDFEPYVRSEDLRPGDVWRVPVDVPARTGSLVVHVSGFVGDDYMVGAFELPVVRPGESRVRASQGEGVERVDSAGGRVLELPAVEGSGQAQ